jgi:ribosomal protein S6
MSEKITRLYELSFILVPTIPESEITQKVDVLKAYITSLEGTISSEGATEYIDLAYSMEKTIGSKKSIYSQGYFGFIKFETTPESLEALKKSLDNEAELVRYMMIKTAAENTIVFKKPKLEAKRDGGVDDEEVVSDSEEISEEIEETPLAHEALPDLLPEIEATQDSVEEKA